MQWFFVASRFQTVIKYHRIRPSGHLTCEVAQRNIFLMTHSGTERSVASWSWVA